MEVIRSIYAYLSANGAALGAAISAVILAAELITRLTPTKTDDAFLTRVGAFVKKVLDLLKVPNNIKVTEVKEK